MYNIHEVVLTHYSQYKQSRDLAWQLLIDNKICELPVKVSNICKNLNIPIISYEKGHAILKVAGLLERCSYSDGVAYANSIFYNEKCSVARQRFTVSHELGHCLLHNGNSIYNREPSSKDNPIEQEANIFASRLLAPACVLWGLGVTTAEEISKFCDISITSAEFRLERLKLMYKREQIFLKQYGHSCFLLSPLERQVYKQFYDYIDKNRL